MQPQQQQLPNFNALVLIPTGAKPDGLSEAAKVADGKLRELYAIGGVIAEHIGKVVCDETYDEVVAQERFAVQDNGQTFVTIPAVLLDPNLRATAVMTVVDPQVADAIEDFHVGEDMKRDALAKANAPKPKPQGIAARGS